MVSRINAFPALVEAATWTDSFLSRRASTLLCQPSGMNCARLIVFFPVQDGFDIFKIGDRGWPGRTNLVYCGIYLDWNPNNVVDFDRRRPRYCFPFPNVFPELQDLQFGQESPIAFPAYAENSVALSNLNFHELKAAQSRKTRKRSCGGPLRDASHSHWNPKYTDALSLNI